MLFNSSVNQSIKIEANNLTLSTNNIFKSIALIFFAIFVSATSFSQSSIVAKNNELIKFCHSVNGLNEGYEAGLESFSHVIDKVYSKVINGDKDIVFPVEQVSFSSHYGDNESNMASLERLYMGQAVGMEVQADIVKRVKLLQREKNKIEMFAKAFADYVNSKGYERDLEKVEVKLINDKIQFGINGMLNLMMDERLLLSEVMFEAENETINDHNLKSILIPMNEDIKYITQLLLDTEKSLDANEAIIKIKSKRISLSENEGKRLKDADYYLKNTEHLDLYKNFYLRYQSLLTKSQNVLSDETLSKEMIHSEWKLNRVSIQQLRNTYNTLKNNALADM